jgi:hypothetical protein
MRVVHHTISIGCPQEVGLEVVSRVDRREGRLVVADFYAELLRMRVIRVGWLKVAESVDTLPHFAFSGDGWSERRRTRWPDPDYPAQVHLDFQAPDLDAVEAQVLELGGAKLAEYTDHRVYADPVGHPICIYEAQTSSGDPKLWRAVFDCANPPVLAPFYEQLMDEWTRIEDSPERIVLKPLAGDLPMLVCQRTDARPPRWGDPDYPFQLHFDFSFDDENAITLARELGAVHIKGEVHADPAGHPFCLGIWRAEIPTSSSYSRTG